MYTRKKFGKYLKEKVLKKESIADIGHWVYSEYLYNIEDIDRNFRRLMITLNAMAEGPEFAFTYEELEIIADDLILGKDVDLDYWRTE